MITFKKVTEADEQLNSQIEELNRKVFPSAETTANLHFLARLYNGASVDFYRFDIHMNGYGIGYIELMAMLNKVNMFINSLIGNGRYNL